MTALKLICQSLAGVFAVGGAVGGTFIFTKSTEEKREIITPKKPTLKAPATTEETKKILVDAFDSDRDFFYLVSSDDGFSSLPSKDLWSPKLDNSFSEIDKKNQNYKCSSVESSKTNIDDDCLLFSLKPTQEKTVIKISEIQELISGKNSSSVFITKTQKRSEIKSKKFFLLKAKKELQTNWAFDSSISINLIEKGVTTIHVENKYATFQVHAAISKTTWTGTTGWIIAKIKSNHVDGTKTSSVKESYNCSFHDLNSQESCILSPLTSYSPTTFNFANTTVTKSQTAINTEIEKYYLIQSVGIKNSDAASLVGKEGSYIETDVSGKTKTTPFYIDTTAFLSPDSTKNKISELITFGQKP